MSKATEEYRRKAKARLQALHDEQEADILNGADVYDLSWLQEYLRPLGQAFCQSFDRAPLKSQRNRWRKEWMEQHQIGLKPEDIKMAFWEMEIDGLTIKSPASVTAVAEKCKRKRVKLEQKDPQAEARRKYYEELNKQYED